MTPSIAEGWANDPDGAGAQEEELGQLTQPFLVVRLDGALYGFRAQEVDEIAGARLPVPVPTAPDTVVGVVHLGGRIVAVVDLGLLLGSKGASRARPSGEGSADSRRLVLLAAGGIRFAVAVDAMLGLHDVAHDTVRAATEPETPLVGSFDLEEGIVAVVSAAALVDRLVKVEGRVV
jgi:chemotaxis signal transduction protein